jgi:hypothetical protein
MSIVAESLSAIRLGERPVLLLDGEELVGAKQNRVLNLSVLVGPHSRTVIFACPPGRSGGDGRRGHRERHPPGAGLAPGLRAAGMSAGRERCPARRGGEQ